MGDLFLLPQQPENYPSVVYKYRDWNNDFHKRLILNKELFLSSPKHFNDPFDCKIPIAYEKLADPTLAYEYFKNLVERNPSIPKVEKENEIQRFIREKNYQNENWLDNAANKFYESLQNYIGVISLSEFKNDIQMWSHYSGSHTGFCIGFKSDKLFFNNDRFGQGGKVEYVKIFPEILPNENKLKQMTKVLYTKHESWKYEQEYRLTKSYSADKVVNFTSDEVVEIILGCSMPDSNVKTILGICKLDFKGIPVFQTFQKRGDFRLHFKQLN